MNSIIVDLKHTQKYAFIESDILRSIAQNITLIVSTKKGTVPHYREFGIPMEFIDRPQKVAKTILISEVVNAVDLFEPRAEIINIKAEIDGEKCYPILEVRLKDEK